MTQSDASMFQEIATTCPAMQSRALSRRIARIFDDRLRPHGLSSSQFALLVGIGASGPCRAKDLAASLSLSPAATTRALDILERNGWVRSPERSATARQVALTPTGVALLRAAYADWAKARAEVIQTIGPLPGQMPDAPPSG